MSTSGPEPGRTQDIWTPWVVALEDRLFDAMAELGDVDVDQLEMAGFALGLDLGERVSLARWN